MIKILANDGVSNTGKALLEKEGFQVETTKIEQENLIEEINKKNYQVLLVRSATKVRKELIDKCPNLKIIGRGGVGMDNIDVEYARNKGLEVINTPTSSSSSVAELVFAHLFSLVRSLHISNRKMPLEGDVNFKKLKKDFSSGKELTGKTLGIIGFGKIGQEVAKRAIGLGMHIIVYDKFIQTSDIAIKFFNNQEIIFNIKTIKLNDVLKNSDFITVHIPKTSKKALINRKEINLMKKGAGIINTSRGGIINENALIHALDNKILSYAGLDVFDNEPEPSMHLIMHDNISLSPHIGGSTLEAQNRIGTELANFIINYFNK